MDELKKALAEKIAMYRKPKEQLCISPVILKAYKLNKTGRNKQSSKKEDRFILCKLNEIGMDTENVYDNVKQAIQNAWQFKYSKHDVFR